MIHRKSPFQVGLGKLLGLLIVALVGVGWCVDHLRLLHENRRLEERVAQLEQKVIEQETALMAIKLALEVQKEITQRREEASKVTD